MTITMTRPQSPFYEQLLGKVDHQLLHYHDARDTFILDKMADYYLNYYVRQVLDKPWNNHLYLAMVVSVERNLDPHTIFGIINQMNTRLKDLFEYYHLTDIQQLDTETHMYEYFKEAIFEDHSDRQRKEFLKCYRTCSKNVKKWTRTKLIEEQQGYFEQFIFPIPSYESRDFPFSKAAEEQAKQTRKSETDAVVPLLPQIRAEGHFRWNQIDRLRMAFLKACEEVKNAGFELPFTFEY